MEGVSMKHNLIFLAFALGVFALALLVGWTAGDAQRLGPTHRRASNSLSLDCAIVRDRDGGEYARCSDGVGYPVDRE